MAKSKKEKKVARREREEQLKSISQRIQDKILLAEAAAAEGEGEEEEIVYTLPPTPAELQAAEEERQRQEAALAAETAQRAAEAAAAAAAAAKEAAENEDRVVLPSLDGGADGKGSRAGASALAGRKHQKMTWEELKLRAAALYGAEAAELVGQHDGNAVDPLFTVRMKVEPHTVPVPFHWHLQRTFLSRQADREAAVGIVPPEVAALGIEKIRATKDKMANPNQMAFVSCFMTGTPLQRKNYHVTLTRAGDVFYEGKWRPKAYHTPGALSKRLRQALGIGPTAPPPWLYSMQTMRRLPPAYPDLRIPGLNAPIPAGGQWGLGEGQWGEPPRADDNSFLFPGVMDEAAATGSAQPAVRWGTVPPLAAAEGAGAALDGAMAGASPASGASPAPSAASGHASPRPAPTGPRPVITPVPFQPQAYVPQHAVPAARVTPQEYVQVQDNTTNSTVAVGYVMMPKDGVPQPAQPPMPPPSLPRYPRPPGSGAQR